MKTIALAEVKDHLSEYLNDAAREDIVITRHGKPAGVLIGFETEDDWFEYRLANDPRFLKRIEQARAMLRSGRGVPWDTLQSETDLPAAGCGIVSDKPRARAKHRNPRTRDSRRSNQSSGC